MALHRNGGIPRSDGGGNGENGDGGGGGNGKGGGDENLRLMVRHLEKRMRDLEESFVVFCAAVSIFLSILSIGLVFLARVGA